MSLRSEICARLLLPLIVTLLTVLAVFKLSGTDLHFAKYCAEATLVYAAVLLFPFIIRAALWGIFQFIVALQIIICQNNFRHSFSLTWSGKTCDIRRSL